MTAKEVDWERKYIQMQDAAKQNNLVHMEILEDIERFLVNDKKHEALALVQKYTIPFRKGK